jgi:hypothetical protein
MENKEYNNLNYGGGFTEEDIKRVSLFGQSAKYQAKRRYSEEDMDNYAEYCINHFAKSQIGQPYLSAKEWFSQFEKK